MTTPHDGLSQLHTSSQVKLAFPGVFCACIALAGPGRTEVLRIAVDSYDRAHNLDAWTQSPHQVGGGCGVGDDAG